MTKEKLDLILVIVQIVTLFVQIASLIAIIVYVKKTSEMASATNKSVDIGQQMVSAARESADATIRSAQAAEESVQVLRDTSKQESAPYVVAYFDASLDTFLIYLVVKNIGRTVASNVKLKFDPPLKNSDSGIEVANLPLIKNGISSVPPNYEILI